MAQFPFVGGSYRTRSREFACERSINLYVEMGGPTSKTPIAMYGTPGLRLWLNLNGGAIRGVLRFSTTVSVVVAGPNVYTVTNTGVATLIGTITETGNIVGMASNGSLVMIANGSNGYFVNPMLSTVVQITDPDFPGADVVYFIDGYFMFNVPGTGRFMITQLYGTDIDGLDFATAEGSPDLLLSLLVDHREAWLFGENSTEVFFNSGNADFPFERINGAYIELGIAAKFSAAKMDNTVYWLSANDNGVGTVQRAIGYQPQRVSDHGVEYAISQMSRIDDAIAYTYQQEGHNFYVLNFPTAQQTWVFDATSGYWHERAWRNPTTAALLRHRAQCQMQFNGKTVVGDWENGNLYYMMMDEYTDNGAPLPRIRICPHLSDPDYKQLFFDALEINMQVGVGLGDVVSTTPGYDPKVMLQWSDDGANTWSNEHWTTAGKIGEYRTRVRWRRLGRARDRVFKVMVTDPVKVAFVGASVMTRKGTS